MKSKSILHKNAVNIDFMMHKEPSYSARARSECYMHIAWVVWHKIPYNEVHWISFAIWIVSCLTGHRRTSWVGSGSRRFRGHRRQNFEGNNIQGNVERQRNRSIRRSTTMGNCRMQTAWFGGNQWKQKKSFGRNFVPNSRTSHVTTSKRQRSFTEKACFEKSFDESAVWALLSSLCDDSNLHISVFK